MATATLLPLPRFVAYDANGNPLAGGLVHTYVPGGTTPKVSYQDAAQTVPNLNPIVLDSAGSCLLYGSGAYSLVTTDSLGNAVPGYSGLSQDLLSLVLAVVPIFVANIAALRLLSNNASPVWVMGYRTPGDGGEGMFVTGTAEADNGGTIIQSAGLTYYRETQGIEVSVKWFGAFGDGVTDDTSFIQSAITSLTTAVGGTISFPNGKYSVSSPIAISANNTLLEGNNCVIITSDGTGDIIHVSAGVSGLMMRDITFWATLPKSAGACVRALGNFSNSNFENVRFGSLDLYVAGSNTHMLWDGLDVTLSFQRVWLDAATEAVVAHHGVRCAGTVAIPAAELQLDHRSLFCTVGVYIGGSAGGVYMNGEISECTEGVRVDKATSGATNREVFFQQGAVIDASADYCLHVLPDSVVILDLTAAWFASAGRVIAGQGVGVFIEPNAGTLNYCTARIVGCRFYNNLVTGINNAGALALISGCQFSNQPNGAILNTPGANASSITSCTFFNHSTAAVTLQNGCVTYGVVANMFSTNVANFAGANVVFNGFTGMIGQNPGIQTGTPTNDTAVQGNIGEFHQTNGSAAMTSGVSANLTSVDLTAGDWNVWAAVQGVPAGTTLMASITAAVSLVSATLPGTLASAGGAFVQTNTPAPTAGAPQTVAIAPTRISIATTTTVYLVANLGFSVSTCTANGVLNARRQR
jgi:hypothetical protein